MVTSTPIQTPASKMSPITPQLFNIVAIKIKIKARWGFSNSFFIIIIFCH